MERMARPKNGGQYALLLQRDQGLRRLRRRQGEVDQRHQDAERVDDRLHLTQPTGDFLFRMAMPATGPIPPEVGKCFEGQAGKYGRDLVSTGPLHDRGRSTRSTSRRARRSSRRAASTARRSSTSSATRTTTRRPTRRRRARTCPTSSSSSSTRTPTTSTTRSRPASSTSRTRRSRRRCCASTRRDPSLTPAVAPELGRPHLVHDDEPDAAAVRRRPRPQGDELGHGQGRRSSGLGRPAIGESRTTSSRTRCSTTSSRSSSRTRRPATTAASRRRRRR